MIRNIETARELARAHQSAPRRKTLTPMTRNHNPPPPLMALLALITFCALGLTILITALNEYATTP